MATRKKRKSWDSYEDYLQSPEWAAIRETIHKRDGGRCQLCGNGIDWKRLIGGFECHHWRYPKDWNDDTEYNAFLLCEYCHGLVHESDYKPACETPTLYISLMSRNIVLDGLRGSE